MGGLRLSAQERAGQGEPSGYPCERQTLLMLPGRKPPSGHSHHEVTVTAGVNTDEVLVDAPRNREGRPVRTTSTRLDDLGRRWSPSATFDDLEWSPSLMKRSSLTRTQSAQPSGPGTGNARSERGSRSPSDACRRPLRSRETYRPGDADQGCTLVSDQTAGPGVQHRVLVVSFFNQCVQHRTAKSR